MKIAIFGDSFSANWVEFFSKGHHRYTAHGWSYFLAQKYDVTNYSQMAVGEYKILKQVQSADLLKFDLAIVMHAGPLRLHSATPPSVYENLKKNYPEFTHADMSQGDLIYPHLKDATDIPDVKLAVDFFEKFVDLEYQSYVSNLFCESIYKRLNEFSNLKHLHLVNEQSTSSYSIPYENIHWIYEKHSEATHHNHLSEKGNLEVLKIVEAWIQENS